MSVCASGCTVLGEHLAECRAKGCRGCRPMRAEVGRLCLWCNQQLASAVIDVPGIVSHLVEMAEPALVSPMAGSGGSRGTATGSGLFSPALAAAEELTGVFGSWVDYIWQEAGEVPDPPWRGVVRTAASVRVVNRELVARGPQVVRASVLALKDLVAWTLRRLPWVAEQEWAPEMMAELTRMTATCLARWPWSEAPRDLPIPCPRCELLSLTVNPPSEFRAARLVTCRSSACGAMWIDDEWTKEISRALRKRRLA